MVPKLVVMIFKISLLLLVTGIHEIFAAVGPIRSVCTFRLGLPRWLSGKESAYQCRRCGFEPWVRKIPWRRKQQPLQYSCPENPMDREAWQATVHRVAKSWIQLSTCAHTYSDWVLCNPFSFPRVQKYSSEPLWSGEKHFKYPLIIAFPSSTLYIN